MGKAYWEQIDPAIVFDYSAIYPTIEMTLPFTAVDKKGEIQTATIPGNSELLLQTIYGKDWRTPKRGYKGVSADNLRGDLWRLVSPFVLSTRLGFNQILHGK